MNSDRPPDAHILNQERWVREFLPAGRCVPKVEKPIMERITESESESDIFRGGEGGLVQQDTNFEKVVDVIVA